MWLWVILMLMYIYFRRNHSSYGLESYNRHQTSIYSTLKAISNYVSENVNIHTILFSSQILIRIAGLVGQY